METYFAVCAGISTFCLVVGTAVLVATLLEVQKAAHSVAGLAERVDERFQAVCNAADQISSFMQSGWIKGAQSAFGILSSLRSRFSRRGEPENAR